MVCYFDEELKLVGINALTLLETPISLRFEGPYKASKAAIRSLEQEAGWRLADVRKLCRHSVFHQASWVIPLPFYNF